MDPEGRERQGEAPCLGSLLALGTVWPPAGCSGFSGLDSKAFLHSNSVAATPRRFFRGSKQPFTRMQTGLCEDKSNPVRELPAGARNILGPSFEVFPRCLLRGAEVSRFIWKYLNLFC